MKPPGLRAATLVTSGASEEGSMGSRSHGGVRYSSCSGFPSASSGPDRNRHPEGTADVTPASPPFRPSTQVAYRTLMWPGCQSSCSPRASRAAEVIVTAAVGRVPLAGGDDLQSGFSPFSKNLTACVIGRGRAGPDSASKFGYAFFPVKAVVGVPCRASRVCRTIHRPNR